MSLSGVLFDMDGLLVDTEPVWMQAELELVSRHGCTDWGEDDQRAILGLSLPLAGDYIRRRTGVEASADEVSDELIAGFLDKVRGSGPIVIQPGALELLTEVAESGLPFALVSASPRSIMDLVTARLAEEGFPLFPLTIAGDEVERGKPDPLPYLTAARRLGIPIDRAIVLEDSVNGVQAGWASGAAAVVAVEAMVSHEPRERVVVRDSLVGLDVAGLRALVDGTT